MAVRTHMIRVNKKGKSIDIGSVEAINKLRAARANARAIKKPLTAKQKLSLKRQLAR